MGKTSFRTVTESRFLTGAAGLLNSLRLAGNEQGFVALDGDPNPPNASDWPNRARSSTAGAGQKPSSHRLREPQPRAGLQRRARIDEVTADRLRARTTTVGNSLTVAR